MDQPRLTEATLALLPERVQRPRYHRTAVGIGIAHLGVGAFHKAHQAVYTDDALAHAGGDWGIAGISLMRPDNRNQLAPQDCLYAIGERDNHGESLRVIGAIREMLVAGENPAAVVARLAQALVRVITLTITEKGYCLRPDGELDLEHADIRHDLMADHAPRSALGFLARALVQRRERNIAAPTLLSCDNLPGNGARLRAALLRFLQTFDPKTADWCAHNARFPSCMVDRIVPASTVDDVTHFQRETGLIDAAFVKTEPFRQWIIEENFAQARPAWEAGGARFVRDIAPFETAKLRLLNGAHSAIAYLACLAGHDYVHQAIADPPLARFIEELMAQEIAPTLAGPAELSLPAYQRELLARFGNRSLSHRVRQIAMDGSQKLPLRILHTVRERLARDESIEGLALVIAAWFRCLAGKDDLGGSIEIADPLAPALSAAARGHRDPAAQVHALLRVGGVFGQDLAGDPRFAGAVSRGLTLLSQHGAAATLKTFGCELR